MDLEQALDLIAKSEKAEKCLYLLRTYIRNALNQPDDPRKRTILTANESFQTEVAALRMLLCSQNPRSGGCRVWRRGGPKSCRVRAWVRGR